MIVGKTKQKYNNQDQTANQENNQQSFIAALHM